MRPICIFFSLFLLLSCNTNVTEEKATQDLTQNSFQLSKNDIETIDYIDYDLSNPAKKASVEWKSYHDIQNLIGAIKNTDLSYFQTDKEIHKTLFNDLNTSIPSTLSSDAIIARMRTVETMFFKLRSVVMLETTEKQEVIATIKEFLISFSNLNLQINKKLEKEAQDIIKANL